MQCELCGKNAQLVTAIVEGAELNVCVNCAKFGKVIKKPVVKKIEKIQKKVENEIIETISFDYSEKIRKAREKLGLKQEELAKKLAEKESVIHKLESGHLKPSIELAKKLENFLKIKIIEKMETSSHYESKEKSENMTIGDLIKFD